MNTRTCWSFLCFVILLGRLSAGEWGHWQGLGGELAADRGAAVVARTRYDETGDDKMLGYRFDYEVHNQSGTQSAHVPLFFEVQDPATGTWTEIDLENPTVTYDIPPMGTVKGSRYSRSARGLAMKAKVSWPEENQPPEKPAEVDAGEKAEKPAAATERPDMFEGVPVDASEIGKGALQKQIGYGATERFAVVLELFRQDDIGDDYGDGNGGTQTWQQVTIGLVESYRDPEYHADDLASFQILSSTRAAVKVRFDVVYAEQLNFMLTHQHKPAARISGLVRLTPGKPVPKTRTVAPSPANENAASETANESGEVEAVAEAGPP